MSDELRRLVREAIAEALGTPDTDSSIPVAIANDADLMAFAREIAGNPEIAEAIKTGKTIYRLDTTQHKPLGGGSGGQGGQGGDFRWLHGVLNEVKVIEISKQHSRVLLGRGAVVTPLARDKARDVKLELVKERS